MEKSTHRVEVVPVVLEPHGNADSLSIVRVWGYTAIVRTADWLERNIGAYIPPDSVVPDTDQFSFLQGHRRIKAKKLRGVQSWGLLVPAPEGSQVGDDVAEQMGIVHYEPPIHGPGMGQAATPPKTRDFSKFDVDAMLRYSYLFTEGEPVIATEKIHGANCRVTMDEDGLHVGSRNLWVNEEPSNIYWRAIRQTPGVEEYLRSVPFGTAIYGEVYGWVQELRYGAQQGQVWFAMFDVNLPDRWMRPDEVENVSAQFKIPMPPVIYRGLFDLERLKACSEGPSLIVSAQHMREGIVVRPAVDRWDERLGRVILKLVNPAYLEKSK
jgi:RNA ligase (TIGR02306 family)